MCNRHVQSKLLPFYATIIITDVGYRFQVKFNSKCYSANRLKEGEERVASFLCNSVWLHQCCINLSDALVEKKIAGLVFCL